MMHDRTVPLEDTLKKEHKPALRYLPRLFLYVFRSARAMCLIFLSLAVFLSLLRPILSLIWGRYLEAAEAYRPGASVLPMLGLILSYFLISFLCELLNRYLYNYEEIERLDVVQRNRFQEQFDTRMYQKLAALPAEMFEVPSINDRIARVFKFTQDAWSGLNREVMIKGYVIVAKAVSVAAVAASLYILEPRLCYLVLIAPIPTLYTTYVQSKLEFRFLKDNTPLQRKAEYFEGLMLGQSAKELKALGLFGFFIGKWKKLTGEYVAKQKKKQVARACLELAAQFISAGASVGAMIWAIVLMTQGAMGLGALGASLTLIQTLISDTGALFSAIGGFISKKNEAAAFFDLIDLPEQLTAAESPAIQTLEFKDVSYRYPLTERYVLQHISVSIRAGERVALVGENGAGKSTFVKLLTGLISPSAGEIWVNGQAEASPAARYGAMATVMQQPARYTTFTVADNVRLGDVRKGSAPVAAALAKAGFEGANEDALLGKDIGGTDLSGGQWQKLAIARAWFRDRGLLVLDEPTGSLDPVAEAEVFQKYLALAAGRTLLMVTHRISVASLADRILVFSGGRLLEDGSHEALMAENGVYARLYQEQAKWYDR